MAENLFHLIVVGTGILVSAFNFFGYAIAHRAGNRKGELPLLVTGTWSALVTLYLMMLLILGR